MADLTFLFSVYFLILACAEGLQAFGGRPRDDVLHVRRSDHSSYNSPFAHYFCVECVQLCKHHFHYFTYVSTAAQTNAYNIIYTYTCIWYDQNTFPWQAQLRPLNAIVKKIYLQSNLS